MRHAIIINEKVFLKKLYKSKKLKVLEEANDNQIYALACAIHFVLTKKVPLNQKIIASFLKINQRKINSLKNQFGNKEQINELLKLRKKRQITIIKKFIPLIKILLSAYFQKPSKTVAKASKSKEKRHNRDRNESKPKELNNE